MSRLCFVFMMLVLSSCATAPLVPRVYLGASAYLELPQPSEIAPVKAVQIISVKNDGKVRNFEAIFESKHDLITISVISPLWPTPMRAIYDGQNISADAVMKKNIPFDFKYVVADLMLIYANADLLRTKLSSDSRLEATLKSRRIVDLKNNKTIVDVNFESEDPFKGSIRLSNLVRNYELEIKTIKVER